MYEAFFQLQRRPFSMTPDAGCFLATDAIRSALDELAVCVERGQGLAVVTGPAGTGKTLLCHRLADELSDRFRTVLLANGRFPTQRALLQAILFELGQPYARMDQQELELALTGVLRSVLAEKQGTVIVIDEAHLLTPRLLERLRTLSDLCDEGRPLARIVLSGQWALEELLATPELEALSQRIGCHATLAPLTRRESLDYIAYRLNWAGGELNQVFTPEAVELICKVCDGVPRNLNQLCDHCLLLAYVAEIRPVGREQVEEALEDLKHLPLQWHVPATLGSRDEPTVDEAEADIGPPPSPAGEEQPASGAATEATRADDSAVADQRPPQESSAAVASPEPTADANPEPTAEQSREQSAATVEAVRDQASSGAETPSETDTSETGILAPAGQIEISAEEPAPAPTDATGQPTPLAPVPIRIETSSTWAAETDEQPPPLAAIEVGAESGNEPAVEEPPIESRPVAEAVEHDVGSADRFGEQAEPSRESNMPSGDAIPAAEAVDEAPVGSANTVSVSPSAEDGADGPSQLDAEGEKPADTELEEEIVIDRYAAIDDGRDPPEDLDAPSRLHRDATDALPPDPDAAAELHGLSETRETDATTVAAADARRYFETGYDHPNARQAPVSEHPPDREHPPEGEAFGSESGEQSRSVGQTDSIERDEQAAVSASQGESASQHDAATGSSHPAESKTPPPDSALENNEGRRRPDRLIERMLPLLDEAIAAEPPHDDRADSGAYQPGESSVVEAVSSDRQAGGESIEPEQRLAADTVRTVLETRQHILEALTDRARRQLDEIGQLERTADLTPTETPHQSDSETHLPEYDIVEPEPDPHPPAEPTESASSERTASPPGGIGRPKRFRRLFTELRRRQRQAD